MNRAPSMSPKMRRIVLRYADWWAGDIDPLNCPPRPEEFSEWVRDESGPFGGECIPGLLHSLAYDGTRGPARKGMKRNGK